MLSRLFRRSPDPSPTDDGARGDASTPAANSGLPGLKAPAEPDQALVDALSESRRRFKDIVEVSGDFAWETDADGTFVFVSPGLTLGYRPDELVGVRATGFLAEGNPVGGTTPFCSREPVRDVDIWLRTQTGRDACLSTSAIPVLDGEGVWRGVRGVCRDVTEERRRNAEFAALQRREVSMARIVRAASEETDPEKMLRSALEEARRTASVDYIDIRRPDADGDLRVDIAVGDTTEAPVLKTVFGRMAESRSLVTAADGDRYHLCAPIIYRDDVTGALLVSRTLSDGTFSEDERRFCDELAAQFALLLAQADAHRRLDAMARTDEMTGRLNRRAFFTELRDRIARAGDGGASGTLFYVDLDNFKAVNDVHGHKRGDEALIALSDLLVTMSRPGDLVARLGGDEFAMWLDRTDRAAAERRASELLDASQGLRIFSGAPDKPLGISVGVAVFEGGSGEPVEELTARADNAMYEIKHGGKSGYVVAGDWCPDETGAGAFPEEPDAELAQA